MIVMMGTVRLQMVMVDIEYVRERERFSEKIVVLIYEKENMVSIWEVRKVKMQVLMMCQD